MISSLYIFTLFIHHIPIQYFLVLIFLSRIAVFSGAKKMYFKIEERRQDSALQLQYMSSVRLPTCCLAFNFVGEVHAWIQSVEPLCDSAPQPHPSPRRGLTSNSQISPPTLSVPSHHFLSCTLLNSIQFLWDHFLNFICTINVRGNY